MNPISGRGVPPAPPRCATGVAWTAARYNRCLVVVAGCSRARITCAVHGSAARTPAGRHHHERLAQFVISRHGALVAAYNSAADDSSRLKIADVSDGPADSWHTVVNHEVLADARSSRFPPQGLYW